MNSPTFAGIFDSQQSAEKVINPIIFSAHNDILKIEEEYNKSINTKLMITRNISRLSPMSQFKYIIENLSGTGFQSEEYFLNKVRTFSKQYDAYIKEKVGEVAIMSRTNINFWIWFRDKRGPYQGRFQNPYPKEYDGDKSDFPRFIESEPSLIVILNSSLIDIAGLLLWNIVLAMGAFLAFNRADVR